MKTIKAIKTVSGNYGDIEEKLMKTASEMESKGLEVDIKFSLNEGIYSFTTLVVGYESTSNPNLLKVIEEQYKVIEEIANPNMEKWADYSGVSTSPSFARFLQNIAEDYLEKR